MTSSAVTVSASFSSASRANTSAAARWKPSGSPASANVDAISSISPTQRHAFGADPRAVAATRSGRSRCERSHSADSAGATPVASASATTARSSAAVPLVYAA